MPAGVGISQGVIPCIRVAIERLRIGRCGNNRIRLQEAPQGWVPSIGSLRSPLRTGSPAGLVVVEAQGRLPAQADLCPERACGRSLWGCCRKHGASRPRLCSAIRQPHSRCYPPPGWCCQIWPTLFAQAVLIVPAAWPLVLWHRHWLDRRFETGWIRPRWIRTTGFIWPSFRPACCSSLAAMGHAKYRALPPLPLTAARRGRSRRPGPG